MASAEYDQLRKDYESVRGPAKDFCDALVEQIKKLLAQNKISLAVPIESRVKSWGSIKGKVERRNLSLSAILELNDLVGVRLILPFKRDLDRCVGLIKGNLTVTEEEDVATRLDDSQFGYQSYHFRIALPGTWLSIPTFAGFEKYSAEIQIRTLAQHIWAVTSHNLQYKQEENVPRTLRRSIYRVSALLETVDLEFERLLREREAYVEKLEPETRDELLNADLLARILDENLPMKNKQLPEDYSELSFNLAGCDIHTSSQLISLINEKLAEALREDKTKAGQLLKFPEQYYPVTDDDIDRAKGGVFFTHAGLIRVMLNKKFGDGSWVSVSDEYPY